MASMSRQMALGIIENIFMTDCTHSNIFREEQLRWTFKLYDASGDGVLEQPEVRKRKFEVGKEDGNSSQLDPLTKHEKQKRKRMEREKIMEPDLFIRPDGLPITFLMQASRAQQRDKVWSN